MPSFAKMLHHHLPSWATLKSLLKFNTLVSPRESSKGDLITAHKRPKPIDFDQIDDNREDRLFIDSTSSSAGIELESLRGVENCTGYATAEAFDDDRVYLKPHDPQQA